MGSTHIHRRSFLQTLGTVAATSMAGCLWEPAGGVILDTHTHFYDPRRPGGVPWPPEADPILYRPVLPQEYRQLVEPLGVKGTVVVEASSRVEDNRWVLDLIAQDPMLIGLVGNLPVGESGFEPAWEIYRKNPKFRGIRIHSTQVTSALQSSLTLDHLVEVARAGLTLDVLVGPEQLGEVATLADKLRSVRIVVDHCANVPMGRPPHPSPWVSGLAACHYAPNVSMKVSGLVEGTGRDRGDAPRDLEVYRPIIDTLWHVLGEDRLLFGSNWPVSTRFASYSTVLAIVQDFFREVGPAAARKYFHRNGERIYGVRLPT